MYKENIGYRALHYWIRRHLPKSNRCKQCELDKRLEVACITGIYDRNLENWMWICRGCHMRLDGRMDSLKQLPFSEEHRKRLSKSKKGKHISKETKRKISEAEKGEKNHFYGKKHSEEARKKMRGKKHKTRSNVGVKTIPNVSRTFGYKTPLH